MFNCNTVCFGEGFASSLTSVHVGRLIEVLSVKDLVKNGEKRRCAHSELTYLQIKPHAFHEKLQGSIVER